MTIGEFGRRLRARTVTVEEVTESCLTRIEAGNPRLNAFITVLADEARRQAYEADRELAAGHDRGPLHGVPLSIKDLMDLAGTRTTAASRVRESPIAERDAPAIAHLRAAGAVFVGKTNLHEFALGTTNEDSAFGPARHPLDPTRSPGGSSGGSAASVAAGMALASVGTDTGGSIRIPAAACGIVGFKPSLGEVSTDGVIPLSPTLDHVGPLAQSVADAWVLRCVLAGERPYEAAPIPASRLRLAGLRSYFCDVLDDDVRASFEDALRALGAAGATIQEADIPRAATIATAYLHIGLREAFLYHAATLNAVPERYTPNVRQRLEMGRQVQAEDYARALTAREALRRDVDAALVGADALILPTMPIPAPKLGSESVRIGSTVEPLRAVTLRLTQLFNLTGHPAISIPCGLTRDGLPCGLQLVGRRDESAALVRVALACETALTGSIERHQGEGS